MTSAAKRLSRVSIAIAATTAIALPATPALAAGYLKLGDIRGEASDKGHGGEIHIESFSWGATRAGTDPAGRKAEKSTPSVSEIVVSKTTDSSTPSAHGAGGGGGAGKVSVHDISITKNTDKMTAARPASGKDGAKGGNVEFEWKVEEGESAPPRPGSGGSFKALVPAGSCKVGARYPTAEFGTGGKVYQLANVVVTGCSAARSDGSIPTETLSLNFDKITWK